MNFIKISIFILITLGLSGKTFANVVSRYSEDNILKVIPENILEQYDVSKKTQSPVVVTQWKRQNSGFLSHNPSYLNSIWHLRSSTPVSNSNKRIIENDDTPYHPVPRSISLQHNGYNDDLENFVHDIGRPRHKRQNPGSFLLMKLGRIYSKANEINREIGTSSSSSPYTLQGNVYLQE